MIQNNYLDRRQPDPLSGRRDSPERTTKGAPGRNVPGLACLLLPVWLELFVLKGEEVAGGRGDGSHQAPGLRKKLLGVEPRENELLLGMLSLPSSGERRLGHEPAAND